MVSIRFPYPTPYKYKSCEQSTGKMKQPVTHFSRIAWSIDKYLPLGGLNELRPY